ncbi:MAG: hypothetical protein KIH62_000045, partial [Candidatus Kerfeldbacteria bacterium]|nr:hypothetical protein [Candidatus Kerfeldbacteria bacterium]
TEKGCLAAGNANGYGPNTSTNVCAVSTSGYGGGGNLNYGVAGAGHGGTGGIGTNTTYAAGITYDSLTAPTLFGSSGGSSTTSYPGGAGGGKIRLVIAGALTLNGSLVATGGNGLTNGSTAASGGGSGGSIYVTAGSLAGTTGTWSVAGGNGAVGSTSRGGGGGGGRIAILYGSDSSSWRSGLTAAGVAPGGTATSAAVAGSVGTLYMGALTVPTTPTITLPTAGATGQSQNLNVTSSTYSSDGLAHTSTDWQISDDNTFSTADCSDSNIVWCAMSTTTHLSSVDVTTVNGTFAHALSAATQLASGTTYYVRVRYTNGAGSSAWSSSVSFTTTGSTPSATTLGTDAFESWAWMGMPTDQASSTSGSSTNSILGWVHLNCASYSACSGGTYNTYPSVSVDVASGDVSGWAWVGNTQADSGTGLSVGWLNFDPAPLADATYAHASCTAPNYYPAPPCHAAQISTSNQQEISGWARFDTLAAYGDTMLGTSSQNNDWGWVLLRGRNTADSKEFGLIYNGTSLEGWAWSGGGTLPSGAGFSNTVGFGWMNFSSAGSGSTSGPASAYVSTQRGNVYSKEGISNPSGTLTPSQYNATYLILTSDGSGIVNFNSELLGEGNFTSTSWSHLDLPDATNGYKGTLGRLDLTKLTTITTGSSNIYGNAITSMSNFNSFTGDQLLNGGVYVVGATCCSGSYTIDESVTFTNGTALPSTGSSYDGSGVIVVNGDLTINENLFYNNTALLDIRNLASVTWIVRGNLTVGENVAQLVGSFLVIGDTSIGDGVHDGTFTTVATNAQQLSVYGLVMARTFSLNRTYQGTAGNDEPSELFYYDGRLLANTPPGVRDYTSLMPIVTQR